MIHSVRDIACEAKDMSELGPPTQTMTTSKAEQQFSEILEKVFRQKARVPGSRISWSRILRPSTTSSASRTCPRLCHQGGPRRIPPDAASGRRMRAGRAGLYILGKRSGSNT